MSVQSKTSAVLEASVWTCLVLINVNVTAALGASHTVIQSVKVQTLIIRTLCLSLVHFPPTRHLPFMCLHNMLASLLCVCVPEYLFETSSRHKWVFESRHLSQWAMWEHTRLLWVRPLLAWSRGPGRHLLWWVQPCKILHLFTYFFYLPVSLCVLLGRCQVESIIIMLKTALSDS